MIRNPAQRGVLLPALAGILAALILAASHVPASLPAAEKESDPQSLAEQLPRIPPTEPQDALQTFKLARGFRLELVACEPDVSDPVDACFDEHGRMYVAEMHGYPFSQEPTRLNPKGGGRPDAGIIRLLQDTDGDGRMDRSRVFADGISWPTSVCCYRGGVFVMAPAHIYYLKDTDGDDVADVRDVVYSGFSRDNVQGLANNLKWGLDNRIYAAGGRNGAELTYRENKLFTLRGRDIRFDPATEQIEPISGGSQFGHSLDDWGNRFVCSNSNHIQHVVLPQRYLDRNPYLGVSSVVRSIAKEGAAAPVYRASPAEPWRIVRTRRRAADPQYRRRLPATELVPIGFFTSATGVTIYRGDAYPEEFRGNAFIGDVGGNLVHRKRLSADGVSFIATRADEKTEFVTSTDNWFRPVNFVNAPDGSLLILDMYRETIEHPASIPEDIKAHLRLQNGRERGRIYRLIAPAMKRVRPPNLGEMLSVELVAQLESPNAWNRQTAQRLLWERKDTSAVPALERLAAKSGFPLARLHALYTLDGLDALHPQAVEAAINDLHPGVREHAVRLAEQFAGSWPKIDRVLLSRAAQDEHPRVLFQLAFTLGETHRDASLRGLARLAWKIGDDRDLRIALLSSVGDTADRLAVLLLEDTDFLDRPHGPALLAELARIVAARPELDGTQRVLAAATRLEKRLELKSRVLQSLGDALRQRGESLTEVLRDQSTNAKIAQRVQELFLYAVEVTQDVESTAARLRAAIGLLSHADYEIAADALQGFLLPTTPPALQLAAIDALSAHADPRVAELLLSQWRGYSPNVRRQVVDSLLMRTQRIAILLDHVASGDVTTAEISPDKRQLLLNHPNKNVQSRAKQVLGAVSSDREKVVAAFQSALELPGDHVRGRKIYEKECSICHQLGATGHNVGPDLASTKNKSPRDLLIAILDPNREAQPNYTTYTVLTVEGKTVSGIITAETARSITLRRAEGKQDVILRSNIERLVSNGLSLMPVGMEKELTPAEMADLIAFVKTIEPASEQ